MSFLMCLNLVDRIYKLLNGKVDIYDIMKRFVVEGIYWRGFRESVG